MGIMALSKNCRRLGRGAAGASIFLGLSVSPTLAAGPAATYHVEKTRAPGGDGGWDYLKVDEPAHLLSIPRGNRVMVVDISSGKLALRNHLASRASTGSHS